MTRMVIFCVLCGILLSEMIPLGFFVQWVYSITVFIVGFIVNAARNFPPFIPLAMVGGALSAAGTFFRRSLKFLLIFFLIFFRLRISPFLPLSESDN